MTRVVLVTTSFPESVPGSEAAGGFVSDFAHALSRRVNVTVVAPGARDGHAFSNSVDVRRYRVPMQPLSLLRPLNPTHWPPILKTLKNGRRTLAAVLDHQLPNHILALWALPSGYWARECARQMRVPYSVWALGSDIWALGRVPLIRAVLRTVLCDAAHRFADGLALADDVSRISGMSCHFLPSARRLPVANVTPVRSGPPYRLAFLGRWHQNKGIDLMLEALEQLPNEGWEKIAAVRIAGGGPLEHEVRGVAAKLKAGGRPLSVEGYMDADEAAALFAWSDFVCIPSRIESIPVVFSDALQARKLVIATPVGDLPRLLENGAAGVLAKAPTASAFAAAIAAAITRPGGANSASLESLRRQFDVNVIVESFLDQIEQAPA